MADITYSAEVLELINIQKAIYLILDFSKHGLISKEDLASAKEMMIVRAKASALRFINSISAV